jgi:OmpA-OmpF porin, OOP family
MSLMMRWVGVFLLLAMGAAHAEPEETNLLAFSNGGLIESASSNYGGSWDALWLLDENPAIGWATEKDAKLPVEIVISLPERSELRRFEFDVAQTENPERTARDVDILVSDTSAASGFTKLATVRLKPGEDGQKFALASPGTGRWVKLIVRGSQGSTEFAEIMEVRGFGVALTTTPPPDVSGTYDSVQFGRFHLRAEAADLTGCYEHKGGLINGGLDGHLMRLRWREEDGGAGPAVMVMFRDGKGFRGLWRREDETGWSGDWDLRKISNDIGACPHWNPRGTNANPVTAGLAAEGRVRLYGINFDTGSDRIRADAKPALDQILAALKANPGWAITIEGHTDSTGTADGNRDLSNRRAVAVRTALAAGGIAATRVTTVGFGQDKPVADNGNALGRAQNRRVELVKQ